MARAHGADATRIAALGSVLSAPTRAAILCALVGGTAHTHTELSRVLGAAASSVSEHVAVLVDAGLVTTVAQGRHRYVRITSAEVADLVERLSRTDIGSAPLPRVAADLAFARSCYGHLAGALGVALRDALVRQELLTDDGLTERGAEHLSTLGVAGSDDRASSCLDWSQRRPHVGGRLGVSILDHCVAAGWLRRHTTRPRVLQLTSSGRVELPLAFGLEIP